jgi:predicted ABC-type ATPase
MDSTKGNMHDALDDLDKSVEVMEIIHKKLKSSKLASARAQSTGILLWGPPGCGKSSIARELSSKFSPMYFIDTDKIVEAILQVWYSELYKGIKAGAYSEEEKENHYWNARNTRFSDLGLPEKYVLTEILKRIDIPKQFSDSEFSAFRHGMHPSYIITYSAVAFLIFLAKSRRHNFMKETNGNNFDHRVGDVFGDVNSILQVVYVSSVDTLIERVSHRTGQLVNAPPQIIRESYHRSYFDGFQKALKSYILNEIIVTNNDSTPKTMIVLSKQHARRGYVMEVRPATLNEEEHAFISGMLTSVGLTILSTAPLRAFFCSMSFTWT